MDVIQITKPKRIRRTKKEVLAERSDPVKAKELKNTYFRNYMKVYNQTPSYKSYRTQYMRDFRANKKLEKIKAQEQAIIDKYLLTLPSQT